MTFLLFLNVVLCTFMLPISRRPPEIVFALPHFTLIAETTSCLCLHNAQICLGVNRQCTGWPGYCSVYSHAPISVLLLRSSFDGGGTPVFFVFFGGGD